MKRLVCSLVRRLAVRFRFFLFALFGLLLAAPAFAQTGNSPWESAVNVLETAFTSTIARGLSLVAIVVAGLTFAFGEGGSKRVLAGVLFGVGMAIAAVSFMSLSDDFSAKTASELCGREDQLKVSYNLSESGHDATISLLTGKAISHRANISASKSYHPHSDFRFDTKTFTELKNAQAVVIAYDGFNPMPPAFCYLKPYYNDPNQTYFKQLEEGQLD